MKNFLIPLLAAITLPTAVNAEIINLQCTQNYSEWKERKDLKDEPLIYIDIDTEKQSSTVDNASGIIKKYNVFITRDSYLLTYIDSKQKGKERGEDFTISRIDGSYVYSNRLLRVDKESAFFDQQLYDVAIEDMEKYGPIFLPIKLGGICSKAKKIKTKF